MTPQGHEECTDRLGWAAAAEAGAHEKAQARGSHEGFGRLPCRGGGGDKEEIMLHSPQRLLLFPCIFSSPELERADARIGTPCEISA